MKTPDPVSLRERAPHPELRTALRSCGSFEELPTPATEEHLILPDAHVELQFYSGDAWYGDERGELRPIPAVWLLGPRSTPTRMVSRGMTRVVSVAIHPWRAQRLLRLETPHGFCTHLGREFQQLAARVVPLIDQGGAGEALARIEGWLLDRCRSGDESLGAVDEAGLELDATRGTVRIADIAGRLGVSVRHLQRQFKEAAGLSPKAMARLIRFSHAHEHIDSNPDANLTALAFELGYADQAHFTREFRAFARRSPGRYAEEARHWHAARASVYI